MGIDLDKYTGQDVIKHDDLNGRPVTTTIVSLSEQAYDDGDVLYAHVQGKTGTKRVKLTPSSCKALQKAYGSKVEDWKGARVRLVPVSGSIEKYNSIKVEPVGAAAD